MQLSSEVSNIVEQLRYRTPKVPREALNKAMTMQDELADICREAVSFTKQNLEVDGKTEIAETYFFHLYSLFLLGYWGDNQTAPILINIAKDYSVQDDTIWDDVFTEEFTIVIAETITEEQLPLLWNFFETENPREAWISATIAEAIPLMVYLERFDNAKLIDTIKEHIIPLCEKSTTPVSNRVTLGNVLLDLNIPHIKELLIKLSQLQYTPEYQGSIFYNKADIEEHFILPQSEILRRRELIYGNRNSKNTIDNLHTWACFNTNTNKELYEPVILPFPTKSEKIGRNEKCPCGSGKKYKKCC